MSDHKFNHPDLFQVLEEREYLRQIHPGGRQGYVVEDLDLLLRVYGPNYNQDDDGAFILVELKHGTAKLDVAKKRTFGLIDRLLRSADQCMEYYHGFYLIQTTTNKWHECDRFCVNSIPLLQREFIEWSGGGWASLSWKVKVPPYVF